MKPTPSRARELKPSAAICSSKPKCCLTKSAEAATSSTFRDIADFLTFITRHLAFRINLAQDVRHCLHQVGAR